MKIIDMNHLNIKGQWGMAKKNSKKKKQEEFMKKKH